MGWHPHVPNLGGVTFAKQLVAGFTGLPQLGLGLAARDPETWQKFGAGTVAQVGSLASTIAKPLGVPGTDWSLSDKVIEPAFDSASQLIDGPDAPKAMDFLQASRHGGIIPAIGNNLMTAAAIAAPFEGGLAARATETGAVAGEAAQAAEGAAAGSDLVAQAAKAQAAADQAATTASRVEQIAHPVRTMAEGVSNLTAAARQNLFPAESVTAATADAGQMPGQVAAAKVAEAMQSPEVMDSGKITPEQQQAVVTGLKVPQAAEEGAASATTTSPLEDAAAAAARASEASTGVSDRLIEDMGHTGARQTFYRTKQGDWSPKPELAADPGEQLKLPVDDQGKPLVGTQGRYGRVDLSQEPAWQAASESIPVTSEKLNAQMGHTGPTQTFYRGEPAGLESAARGTEFHANPEYAKNFAGEGGKVYRTELPIGEDGNPLVGQKGETPGAWELADESGAGTKYADAAREIEERQPKIPKTKQTSAVDAGLQEPVASGADSIATDTNPGITARESSAAAQQAARLAAPVPAWARRLTDALPDGVNRVLTYLNTPIDRFRLHAVFRDYERFLEIAQHQAARAPEVLASSAAARELMEAVPGLSRFDVSHMIGEEVSRQVDLTSQVNEMVKATANGDPVLQQAWENLSRKKFPGIKPEVWDALDDDQKAFVKTKIDEAAEAYHRTARERLDTLLTSSKGTQGLEQALTDDNSPIMTMKQAKDYKQAMLDLRRAAKLQARNVDQLGDLAATIERTEPSQLRAAQESARLKEQIGVEERTAESLRVATPPGIANMDQTIALAAAGIAENQGFSINIATGAADTATEGFHVGIAQQGQTVPLEVWNETGQEMVRKALLEPRDAAGELYGEGIYHGPDARLGGWQHVGDDGRQYVTLDISQNTLNGTPLTEVQARQLGLAYQQDAIFDIARGEDLPLSQDPNAQNLAAHYLADVLSPKSDLSRIMRELDRAGKDVRAVTPEEAEATLRFWQTQDYGFSRTNPEYTQGDIFSKVHYDVGKAAPTGVDWLAQTVLGMTPDELTGAALNSLEPRQVSDALAWYYDSHDYIEQQFRNKPVTLLNGEVRDSADLMYDLLAVTSVMADPTTNLGRALSGMANLDDFMSARVDHMSAAKALMDQLEEIPAESADTGAGFRVARRFAESPDVQALTDQTSMVTVPKYNVMDVLSGRLKLNEATTADVARLPEYWSGTAKALSDRNMPRANVSSMIDTLHLDTPGTAAYQEWAAGHQELQAVNARISSLREANKAAGIKNVAKEVLDGTPYKTFADLQRALKESTAAEADLLKDPAVSRAYDQALMEFRGSSALAKLRSFRDNMADPHGSLGVTLDSVMGRAFGFVGQDWNSPGMYSNYAAQLRIQAEQLGETMGREVKPHEVQALHWVYAKTRIGQQDWGRLVAHSNQGEAALDAYASDIAAGRAVNPRGFDPLNDYWNEELGYSREVAETRFQRRLLADRVKMKNPDPADVAELARLKAQDLKSPRAQTVTTDTGTVGKSGDLYEETRKSIPYDAKKLQAGEESYGKYLELRDQMQQDLANGDVPSARKKLRDYTTSRRKAVEGTAGGSFQDAGERARGVDGSVNQTARARLTEAQKVPAPTEWNTNYVSNLAARFNRENGLAAPTGIDTTARVNPARTAEVYQAVQDLIDRRANGTITPEEDAASAASYASAKEWIDKQYEFMTGTAPGQLGLDVQYVTPDQEYGLGTLGDNPQPDVTAAHAELVDDVRTNNRLKVRGTALAGDGPNAAMGEMAPDGVMYNDKLRAVHDFYGHAQAANDFSRDGENVAQMLHLQMFPEEAWPALVTEFRAQTAYLVHTGEFMEAQLQDLLPDAMRQPDYMLRGSGEDLFQAFGDKVRGALNTVPDKTTGRLTTRLFEDANLETLFHEGAHLVRRMLPQADLDMLAEAYPGILGETTRVLSKNNMIEEVARPISEVQRTAEEAFVSDFMGYVRKVVAEGGDANSGPLADAFRKIAANVEEQHYAALDPMAPTSIAPDVDAMFTRMFNPDIERPDVFTDPLSAQRNVPGGVETKKFPWESDAEFARRDRQYGEARQSIQTARIKAAAAAKNLATINKTMDTMREMLDGGVMAAGREAGKVAGRAYKTIERLSGELEDPLTRQVAPAWQPAWSALQEIAKEAEGNPELTMALQEIPQSFSEMLKWAAEEGLEPAHIPDMTWEKAQKYLFGHITIGDETEMLSSLRKTRTGALTAQGLADRSIEAMGAGTIMALHEVYANASVGFIEKYIAQPLTEGASIPDGWRAWDPTRDYILSGTKSNDTLVAPGATMIVPDGVSRAIDQMSRPYDHWGFRTITRITKPWRFYLMTMSPSWYIRNFVGNLAMASSEGVRFSDWMTAWKQFRSDTLPDDVLGQGFAASLTDEAGRGSLLGRADQSSILSGRKSIDAIKDELESQGKGAALNEARRRMLQVNENVEQISRAAVYEKMLRTGASREAALTRAYTAMIDYGDLSPFERSAVRAVIPFYAWQKGILKLIAQFPSAHPIATALLLSLGSAQREVLQDHLGGSIPDAYNGLITGGGLTINAAPLNPFSDGTKLLTPEGLEESLSFGLDLMIRDALNDPRPGTGYKSQTAAGSSGEKVDYAQGILSQLGGAAPLRTADQLTSGTDVYGQSPSLAGTLAQVLGAPRTYGAGDVAKIAARVSATAKTREDTAGTYTMPTVDPTKKISKTSATTLKGLTLPKVPSV